MQDMSVFTCFKNTLVCLLTYLLVSYMIVIRPSTSKVYSDGLGYVIVSIFISVKTSDYSLH